MPTTKINEDRNHPFYLNIPPSFDCPKEGARKGHPAVPSARGGYIALLTVAGTVKNSPPAADQTVLPSFPGNSCDAQWHRMGCNLKTQIFYRFTQPSSGAKNGRRRDDAPVLCEQREKSTKGRPSDRLHFLLVRFLYASKENERI